MLKNSFAAAILAVLQTSPLARLLAESASVVSENCGMSGDKYCNLASGEICKSAANAFFNMELMMDTGKIEIEDAKMCTDLGRMILWVTLKNKEMAAQEIIA